MSMFSRDLLQSKNTKTPAHTILVKRAGVIKNVGNTRVFGHLCFMLTFGKLFGVWFVIVKNYT